MTIKEWDSIAHWFKHKNAQIHYLEEGEGETLILIHGFPTSSWDFAKVFPELIKNYHCVCSDLIGLGRSSSGNSFITISDQAEAIEALLENKGITKAHIFAHDLGDTVALELMCRSKEGVSKIDRTLALNPQDVSMLEIKAMNAFQNNDLAASLKWFRQAMDAGVEGERAELIQQAIDRLEEDLGVAGAESPSPSPSSSSTSTVAASPAASGLVDQEAVGQRRLEVLVEIAPGVQVDPQARVFVFARAMRGPPMPLAVQQMTVSALPRLVTLDGSMGMMAGMSLADFDQVQVVARISSTGIANVSPDDYQALSGAVDMTINNGVISLTLSQRVKDQ